MTSFRVVPLKEEHARQILLWRYPPPYDFYDPPEEGDPEYYVSEFLNPTLRFHAVLDELGRFIGFCSFGLDGQVPGGNYARDALDIGVGMKPEFTGAGLGARFFEAILQHAAQDPGVQRFRVTVANFNKRAMTLYRKFDFRKCDEFEDARHGVPYTIMIRDGRV
ncbi:MAG TPA: GNAT family protein [Pseudomonadales bacterium]|nr:GNAT family protein [Pseudomonadales bacterium]